MVLKPVIKSQVRSETPSIHNKKEGKVMGEEVAEGKGVEEEKNEKILLEEKEGEDFYGVTSIVGDGCIVNPNSNLDPNLNSNLNTNRLGQDKEIKDDGKIDGMIGNFEGNKRVDGMEGLEGLEWSVGVAKSCLCQTACRALSIMTSSIPMTDRLMMIFLSEGRFISRIRIKVRVLVRVSKSIFY
jgi:hypothetical protein